MTRLFAIASVDYVQWRALIRVYTVMDYAALLGAYGSTEARRAALQMALLWGFLSSVGLGLGLLVWGARDAFFAATVVVTTLMFWAGMMVLGQPGFLASPEDHEIIGARPVTSRTYFAVRLTAMLLMVLETTVLLGWIPAVAFLTRRGGSLPVAAAAVAAMVAATLTAATGLVAVYGWLIRVIPPARLTRVLTQAGAAVSLALSAGLAIGLQGMLDSEEPFAFVNTILPRDLRTMWFPGAWFASYVPLAQGSGGSLEALAAAGSGVVLLLFASALGGRMSFDYAARIAQLGNLSTPAAAPLRDGWLFRRAEARAVAMLVASHLRSDVKFQLAIASNVVMGLVMTFATAGFRMPVDPFTATGSARLAGAASPLVALVMVPMQMYQTIVATTAYEASWIFFVTGARAERAIRAARDTIALYVLLPLVCLLGAFHVYAYGHVGHAAVHTILLAAIAYLALQFTVLVTPRLPFSVPLLNERRSPLAFGSMLLIMLVGMPFAFLAQWIAYLNRASLIAVFTALGLLMWALNALSRHRIQRKPFHYWRQQ